MKKKYYYREKKYKYVEDYEQQVCCIAKFIIRNIQESISVASHTRGKNPDWARSKVW